MRKITTLILALVLVTALVTSTQVSAAEQPSLHVFGSYTIQDNGQVSYELRMDGDKVCYLGFVIHTDLRIVEIQTDDSAFHEIMHEGNKVIAYSIGNVSADHALVIKVVLEAPTPTQSYGFDLVEVQAYNFSEDALQVTTACPVIQVRQEAPSATEPSTPTPTEPTTTEPKPTNPKPTNPEASTPPQPSTKPQSGNPGNANTPATPQGEGEIIDLNQIDSVEESRYGFLSKADAFIQNYAQENPFTFAAICVVMIIFVFVVLFGGDSKEEKDNEK